MLPKRLNLGRTAPEMRLLKGISVYTLAENMGTSIAMIEKHYGHLKPEMAADELTKE